MLPDLIYDIGLHKGMDARWYLAKGFRVVGLEAVPALCERARETCADAVSTGRLTIIQGALYHHSGESVPFFITKEKDDWGSLYRGVAQKGLYQAQEIAVRTVTLDDLVKAHGIPYYIKCDIEGGDAIFVEQLERLETKPAYVSIELTRALDLARLVATGYTQFQIVNQLRNPQRTAPNPAREGVFAPPTFTHEMSGLFGRELPEEKWISFDDAMRRYLMWKELLNMDDELALGWIDVHARLA